MIRPLISLHRAPIFGVIFFAATLVLTVAAACRADETVPVNHKDTITVHLLDGESGKALVHAHVILLGGYDQGDIVHHIWQQEGVTDEQGNLHLTNQMENLPFLQVQVEGRRLCLSDAGKVSFSVELVRRDGVSAPNRCGIVTEKDAAGVLNVFVKSKKSDKNSLGPRMPSETGQSATESPTKDQVPGVTVKDLPLPELDLTPSQPQMESERPACGSAISLI